MGEIYWNQIYVTKFVLCELLVLYKKLVDTPVSNQITPQGQ